MEQEASKLTSTCMGQDDNLTSGLTQGRGAVMTSGADESRSPTPEKVASKGFDQNDVGVAA